MKWLLIIFLLFVEPSLLVLVIFYYGVRYVMRAFSFASYGIWQMITLRVIPFFVAVIILLPILIAVLEEGLGGILIFLPIAGFAAYRAGFFSRYRGIRGTRLNTGSDFEYWDEDSRIVIGRRYETYVQKKILKQEGWKVKRIGQSGDQGADLLVKGFGIKIAVQCKWVSSGRVGNSAVQQVFAAKSYYGCTHACVVTNSTYTAAAIDLAERTNVFLLHHIELPRFLRKMRFTNRRLSWR